MFVVSLISNPAGPGLPREWPENLRSAWGGGSLAWLAPGAVAEFTVSDRPSNFDEIRQAADTEGIDLNIFPAEGRRKSLLLADMDSTMIEQECIDELAEVAGVGNEVRDVTARAMNGELDFEEALRARLSLMKGLDAGVIDRVLREKITLASGGPAVLATMKRDGAYAALVSGGFTAFTSAVARALGFDEHRANVLGVADGCLTGDVDGPILGREAKIATLKELCTRLGIKPSAALAVGDGANDLGMLHLAGAGVALHAKPSVAAQSDLRINHGDLTALLYLQGFRQEEFVEVPVPTLA